MRVTLSKLIFNTCFANSFITYSAFTIFESVNTVYGAGYVAEIRENDYVVKLANWALAQGQSPTLYLGAEALR